MEVLFRCGVCLLLFGLEPWSVLASFPQYVHSTASKSSGTKYFFRRSSSIYTWNKLTNLHGGLDRSWTANLTANPVCRQAKRQTVKHFQGLRTGLFADHTQQILIKQTLKWLSHPRFQISWNVVRVEFNSSRSILVVHLLTAVCADFTAKYGSCKAWKTVAIPHSR